ncbi:aromatic prenyltransferase [Cryphonectria parasitica EP155]|uniref:Aromatic prenyltransferase n=1 Tax=Cryphonectria parasitica (strain ATCC 38755 / EP155) TaxID=660469 RepID=A0A9P4Y5V0_CRYP1|nr:aromatic prenyltransferase [Cryphonectria parasitica EP155]KAF3766665.1 aromatic prenyltransferase [Cryphonectria parasitica EP155]
MLRAADYPQATQHAFLSYYRDAICPLLGDAPDVSDPSQALSWTWDGSTHEYSFEFKKGDDKPEVRFVLDACRLRPVDASNPLSPLPTDMLIETFASRTPGFDSTWYRALKRHFDYSHLPADEQHRLCAEAGHMSPFLVGFDIGREVPAPWTLPVVGKAYFLPCFAAAAEKTTRFATICAAIRSIPDIDARPNILSSLCAIEAYLKTKPLDWMNGARFLATDFLSPDEARLKIYLRCPSTNFEDIWDYFTLGGRIPGLEEDKEKYRDFIDLLGGVASRTSGDNSKDEGIETDSRRKLTTLYFSIDNRTAIPSPKIAFCARNFAVNDTVVAQGLDTWFTKYGWSCDERSSVEDLVTKAFTHRSLDKKSGIFTFIGLARKNPTKPDLSIQTYLCPELYHSPRGVVELARFEDLGTTRPVHSKVPSETALKVF